MEIEIIDKKSNEFAQNFDYNSSIKELISLGFYQGAIWRAESIWHPITEKPDFNSLSPFGNDIIAFSPNNGILSVGLKETRFDAAVDIFHAIAWAYVRDFLPINYLSQYKNFLKDNFNKEF